ncbi:E3 ubiquitin-protein ligase TRIM39-like [Scomber japonicus]|uniref:E3 ubiquitin-protein ligase TRIM39-like n=1 Tax=Scomber japonicus TaxID=13676 RepID=UPI002304DB3C|nr:E3 ubiquitin-protein ligase TRIM39-like [Scomber japonicus]
MKYLTSVRFGQKQKLPENPERFEYHPCVLGSEGFNSGTHSWDVERSNSTQKSQIHPRLYLSEDLNSVRCGQEQRLPENPERFDHHHCVLGSQGFNLGTHIWDVESENDLSCSVCHEIFRDPVVLTCTHSFCKACLENWWREKQLSECPICKKRSSMSEPPVSLTLKNVCEAFLQNRDQRSSAGPEPLCSEHSEKLKLYCLDHQQPVCVVCRDSETHNNHKFTPINEATPNHKEKLQKSLKPLQEKLKLLNEVKGNCDKTADYNKVQARDTERQIKEQFKKLHQLLQEEEEARISALKEEEEQKSQIMKEKIEGLSTAIAVFSDTIRVAEEELRADDVSFMLNYKTILERVQQLPLLVDPELVSGALIDVAKHLGNLTFNVWTKMKEMVSYTPVILDPNTAHPKLYLSEDLTSVRRGEKQKLPENPERFDHHHCVLGSQGFHSGTHSWDVEVRDDKFWGVGVVNESVGHKGTAQAGYWEVYFLDGKYTAASSQLSHKVISLKKKLQRSRVHLDYNKGKVSFCDPDTNTHIHTFTHTFTERLFPYIGTMDELPLKILPATVSVTKDLHTVPLSTDLWSVFHRAAVERVQQRLLLDDPELVSGALIDVAKHLGNLTYNVWTKMKEIVSYTPVILDPNTAHPRLYLSEDLTSVRCGQKQRLPENPERFDRHLYVLASQGFNSGTHSWDVEVRDDKFCCVAERQMLVEEWDAISQQCVTRRVISMRKRCQAVVAVYGSSTRY